MRISNRITARRLVLGATLAALVGVGVGVATAGGGQDGSLPGLAAYERARTAVDALPSTEVAARAAEDLGLVQDASRAIAHGGGRTVYVAPAADGSGCLVVADEVGGNVPAICGAGTSSVFSTEQGVLAVLVRSEGDPAAPDVVEVAGAVAAGAGVAEVRVETAAGSVSLSPTQDGGFLASVGADVRAVVALDGAGGELARFTPGA